MFAAMLGAISAIDMPTACHTDRLRRNEVVGGVTDCLPMSVAISSPVSPDPSGSVPVLNRKEKRVKGL
jgi:hypothetical protein